MQSRTCPKCASTFSVSDGWAKSAVALLMPAPAVPDMATQVRCPYCHHLFADGDVRYQDADPSRRVRPMVVAACVLFAAWLLYKFFSP
jgi:hypothetical protein